MNLFFLFYYCIVKIELHLYFQIHLMFFTSFL